MSFLYYWCYLEIHKYSTSGGKEALLQGSGSATHIRSLRRELLHAPSSKQSLPASPSLPASQTVFPFHTDILSAKDGVTFPYPSWAA